MKNGINENDISIFLVLWTIQYLNEMVPWDHLINYKYDDINTQFVFDKYFGFDLIFD